MLEKQHAHTKYSTNTQKQTPFSFQAFHNNGCSLKPRYKLQPNLPFLQQDKETLQVLVSIHSSQKSKLVTRWYWSAHSVPKHLNFLNANL